MGTRISQLPPKGANLANTDLLMISQTTTDGYESKSITGAEIIASAQDGVQPTLVSGMNIKTVNDTSLLGSGNVAVQPTLVSGTNIKTINSTSLLGSGDVAVQPTLVSGTNIKTVNGNSLLGSGNLVVGGGLTIGTTAITSGTVGRVLFEGTGNVLQESANLFWDNTNSRLGVGGSPGAFNLDVVGAIRSLGVSNFRAFSSSSTLGTNLTTTAAALFYQNTFNGLVALGGYANSGGEIQSAQNGGVSLGGSLYIQRQAGNVIIGSSTDAGYKLDVNGTARVQGKLSVNTPTATSAVMEVTSTTQGFLPPRMTTTQKNAIASPTAGLVVYDTTLNKLCVYTTAWETITSV